MGRQITFRIVLESPPAGVDIGLQKGSGSKYETVQKQRSNSKDLRFEFTAELKPSPKTNAPILSGPFVQGPPDGRFVYLDIGTYAGQSDSIWARRLKIPLTGVIPQLTGEASAADVTFETRVPGTGRDGGPTCATVKPFAGWTLARSKGGQSKQRTPSIGGAQSAEVHRAAKRTSNDRSAGAKRSSTDSSASRKARSRKGCDWS